MLDVHSRGARVPNLSASVDSEIFTGFDRLCCLKLGGGLSTLPRMSSEEAKSLVTLSALKDCELRFGDKSAAILDISFIRIVTAPFEGELEIGASVEAEFCLERQRFKALVELKAKGERYFRFGFTKLAPSGVSHVRSFLSPKKVGESFLEDGRAGDVRHYHGLKEAEVWFEPGGITLFTFLDDPKGETQILLRLLEPRGPIRVGRVLRADYMELKGLDAEIPVVPLSERDSYVTLSECRDIVTNMRPATQAEYDLKQKLLRAISDSLYSTSQRVEIHVAKPVRATTLPLES